jgi:hypothetical protein
MGTAWSEPILIRLAYSYEQATRIPGPAAHRPTSQATPKT